MSVNNPPTGFLAILGDPAVGQVLTARPNAIRDADGMGPGSFQWTRDGIPVIGATGQTYMVTEADLGRDIGYRFSYIDGDGNQETLTCKPKHVEDPLAAALHAIYFIIFNRRGDDPGMAFYSRMYRQHGLKLSEICADMERNKERGAR